MKPILVLMILTLIGSASGISFSMSSNGNSASMDLSGAETVNGEFTLADGGISGHSYAKLNKGGSFHYSGSGSNVDVLGESEISIEDSGKVVTTVSNLGQDILTKRDSEEVGISKVATKSAQVLTDGSATIAAQTLTYVPKYYNTRLAGSWGYKIPEQYIGVGGMTMQINNQNLPPGLTIEQFQSIINNNRQEWNTLSGKTLFQAPTITSDAPVHGNGKDDIYFDTSYTTDSRVLAYLHTNVGTELVDNSIYFKIFEWDMSLNKKAFDGSWGAGYTKSLDQVSSHELGHAGGWQDTFDPDNSYSEVMNIANPAYDPILTPKRIGPLQSRGAKIAATDLYVSDGDVKSTWEIRYTYGDRKFVCAENGGGTYAIADRIIPLEWEQFTIRPGFYENSFSIQSYNGKYLCAENGGGSTIGFTRDVAAEWESFYFINPDPTVIFPMDDFTFGSEKTAIMTSDMAHLVSAWDGPLVADRHVVDVGEWFELAAPMAA